MKFAELGKVADVNWGDTSVTKASYVESGFPAYSATGSDGFLPYFDYDRDAIVLSAIGARCGKTWFASGKWSVIKNTIRFWSESADLDNRYLYWLTADPDFWPKRGAAQPFITIGDARKLKIPLPPLAEQKRIAAILDQADELRRKRQRSLDRLSTLGQAIFHEMFGDPAINPKGWPTLPLGALASKFSDGPFGSNLKSEHYVDDGVRVIRLQNIGVDKFIDRDKAFISVAHFRSLRKHECLPGDVLVGTMGDPNLRACILPESVGVALNKADCVQIRPKGGIATAGYICGLLNCPSTELMAHDLILGQTRARISMGRLKGLNVPVPTLALQAEYEIAMGEIDRQKMVGFSGINREEALFQSLQHRAFRGEL